MKNIDATFIYDLPSEEYGKLMDWLNESLDSGIVKDMTFDLDRVCLHFCDDQEGLKFLLQWR